VRHSNPKAIRPSAHKPIESVDNTAIVAKTAANRLKYVRSIRKRRKNDVRIYNNEAVRSEGCGETCSTESVLEYPRGTLVKFKTRHHANQPHNTGQRGQCEGPRLTDQFWAYYLPPCGTQWIPKLVLLERGTAGCGDQW
jgi:hypothetical protein